MMAVYVFFGLFFVLTIVLSSLIFRSSSVPNSMNLRYFLRKMGVSSSLVRRNDEELWEDEQTMKYSKSSFNVNLEKIKIPRNQEKYSIVWDFMFENVE